MEQETRIRTLERRVTVLSQALVALACLAAFFSLVAWRTQSPQVVRATKFEVTDANGKVRARVEAGKISLLNPSGLEKAVITADDANGNLTLSGGGQKRISMFMSDSIPLIVLYNEKGEPIASLPAAIR